MKPTYNYKEILINSVAKKENLLRYIQFLGSDNNAPTPSKSNVLFRYMVKTLRSGRIEYLLKSAHSLKACTKTSNSILIILIYLKTKN